MRNLFSLFAILFTLFGCSSPTSTRNTNISLVNDMYFPDLKYVTTDIDDRLSRARSGEEILIQDKTYLVGNSYFSASGNICLVLRNNNNETRHLTELVCRKSKSTGWYFSEKINSRYEHVGQ